MRAYISTGVNSWAEFSVNGEEVEVRDEYSEGEDSASVYDYLSISIYSEDTNEQLYQAEYSVFYGTRDEILSFFDGLDYDLDSLEEEDPESWYKSTTELNIVKINKKLAKTLGSGY